MSDLIDKLGNASRAVYIACPEVVAEDISGLLRKAGERIALLEAAIRKHKDTVWGSMKVRDPTARELYAVLQEQGDE